jgi:hypothetical protein
VVGQHQYVCGTGPGREGEEPSRVLWEPGAGDRLRRPGGREVTRVPAADMLRLRAIGLTQPVGDLAWA